MSGHTSGEKIVAEEGAKLDFSRDMSYSATYAGLIIYL